MIIITLRTDRQEAEIGLYDSDKELAYSEWSAHKQLAETIHKKLQVILNESSIPMSSLQGIAFYKGPGSFTGLRIGLSVANALAYGLNIPIVSSTGPDWIRISIDRLKKGENEKIALPEYGAPVNITEPRK